MELKKMRLLQISLFLLGNRKEILHFRVFAPLMMREQTPVRKNFKPSIAISAQPLHNVASRISPRTRNFIEHLTDDDRTRTTQKYFSAIEDLSPVFMASAACMMVRRTFFENLGGFDDRLPLGYEDVEICWRAWVHGLKTLSVPGAICWHRVGSSIRSLEAARFTFRGVLKGRLLLATKLLPPRYALRTWLISTAGLIKDVDLLRWKFATDRMVVLFQMAGLVAQLLREKSALFRNASNSPEKRLEYLLRLTEDDVQGDQRDE